MKLVTFSDDQGTRIGRLDGDLIVDLALAAPELPQTMIGLLRDGEIGLEHAAKAHGPEIPLADVTLQAPVPRPGKIMAIGLNYADHIQEMGAQPPKFQTWFSKAPSGVVGPGASVLDPVVSDMVDYEAELCVIIGKAARHVPEDRAGEVIGGYCCGNDISVRDWQKRTPQFVIGKSFDTHCPMGPWLVTPDEVADPHALNISCSINGEVRQNSNTKHLIFTINQMIAELSSVMTLEPGDVIFTGTPGGVGMGMTPPGYLKDGDVMQVAIEGLGTLENPVVAEQAKTQIG